MNNLTILAALLAPVALLALLVRLLRARHILHTWKYTPTPEGWLTRRACTHPGCGAREKIDRDDWGAFWLNDNDEGKNQ